MKNQEKTKCRKCGRLIDELDIFPGHICIHCHEQKFNAEVMRNGGVLPRPDFTRILGND